MHEASQRGSDNGAEGSTLAKNITMSINNQDMQNACEAAPIARQDTAIDNQNTSNKTPLTGIAATSFAEEFAMGYARGYVSSAVRVAIESLVREISGDLASGIMEDVATNVAPGQEPLIEEAVARGVKAAIFQRLEEMQVTLPKSDRSRVNNSNNVDDLCRWYVRAMAMDRYDDLFPEQDC